MTKEEVEAKIKAILNKDASLKYKLVSIKFKDKTLEQKPKKY